MRNKISVLVVSAALFPSNTIALETLITRSETTYNEKSRPVANGSQIRSQGVTSECLGAAGIDARGQFIGFSFFRSTQIKHCDCRENAKTYEWLREHEKAIAAMDVCQPKPTRKCFIFFKCKEKVEIHEKAN